MAKPAVRQADDILFYRVFSGPVRNVLEPEKRLMLAILEDAIACLDKYYYSPSTRERQIYEDALAWIKEDDPDLFFSFTNICEALGLNVEYVRRGILKRDREIRESLLPPKKFAKTKSRS